MEPNPVQPPAQATPPTPPPPGSTLTPPSASPSPASPSQPNVPPPITPPSQAKPKKTLAIIISFLIVAILGVAGYFGYQYYQSYQELTFDEQPVIKTLPAPTPNADPTANWTTYENESIGYSFKYPSSIKINPPPPFDQMFSLQIQETLIRDIQDAPLGYTQKNAIDDQQSLLNNQYGHSFSSITDSEKLVNLGPVNAKTLTKLSEIEICDVQFTRQAIFYLNDYQVIITLRGPKDQIISQNLSYFTDQSCGEDVMAWDLLNNSHLDFYNQVSSNNLSSTAQEWYNYFDQILSTFKTVNQAPGNQESNINIPANWKTYTNTKFDFQIKYPPDWTARSLNPGPPSFQLVDDSNGFITFPNIYTGVSNAKTYISVTTDGPQNQAYSSYEDWVTTVSSFISYSEKTTSQGNLADIPATIVTGTPTSYFFPATITNYYFKTPDNSIYFSISITEEQTSPTKQTVDLILSSFQLTN